MNRRNISLFILFALFFVLIINNIMRRPEVRRVSELAYKTGAVKVAGEEIEAGLPGIKSGLLSPEREKFRMGKRGIFEPLKFVKKKKPPKPAPKPEPEPEPKPEPEPEPTPMEKAVASFTFLGFMEAEKVKTIFLTREGEIYIVKEGDTILDNYLAKRITDNKIVISSYDGSEVLEISLVEHEPLMKR